jgi:hypothetical protein
MARLCAKHNSVRGHPSKAAATCLSHPLRFPVRNKRAISHLRQTYRCLNGRPASRLAKQPFGGSEGRREGQAPVVGKSFRSPAFRQSTALRLNPIDSDPGCSPSRTTASSPGARGRRTVPGPSQARESLRRMSGRDCPARRARIAAGRGGARQERQGGGQAQPQARDPGGAGLFPRSCAPVRAG